MPLKFDLTLLPEFPDLSLEAGLWAAGVQFIAGIDEAGRGALAGPVAAAALILPPKPSITEDLAGVRDSKQMTSQQRESWAIHIRSTALTWGVGLASQSEIDDVGIISATRLATQRAVDSLSISPEHLLLDYLLLPDSSIPQTSLIKGDARSLTIAAASIIAKTTRDALLCELDSRYPGYGFTSHKGYGTEAHLQALTRLGPCPAHRLSFQPVREMEIMS